MPYDVVVVGGGVGGLTVAALLSARGLSVCLLERQSQVGGCIGRVEHGGYNFEPGMGLYSSWGEREIYDRIFSELRVDLPATSVVTSNYVVRLAGHTDVTLFKSENEFSAELRRAFPESPDQAVEFYKLVDAVAEPPKRGLFGRVFGRSPSSTTASATALDVASTTAKPFQRFIDAQLKAFLHTSIERCSFAAACRALRIPRQNLYSFNHGVAELGDRLAESFKSAGGVIRLNSPALRIAYDETGKAIGVDLLSGETIVATKAIVSNLTCWDTYGRLIGLQRTPTEIKNELKTKQSRGAYVIYASVEDAALNRLPARNFLVADPDVEEDHFAAEFTMSVATSTSERLYPVTLKTSTEVNPWFAFQTSEEDFEQRDQLALEEFWTQLHKTVPELGAAIEVIETANPRTYYDETRRKLGMVMGSETTPDTNPDFRTSIPNLFMVGDSTGIAPNLESVSQSALLLANHLTE